jgi:hypothetical protein
LCNSAGLCLVAITNQSNTSLPKLSMHSVVHNSAMLHLAVITNQAAPAVLVKLKLKLHSVVQS